MERGEMILASESDRLLNVAFSSLNPRDKYETVLTGLCAKIIDGGAANAKEGMVDPMRLMEEMNSGRIAAGPRGVIGLIDATALTSDAGIMSNVLSLVIKNGAILRYGSLQRNINQFPRSTSFAFGMNNQEQRLESLPPVPDDDRATEVSQAVIFSAVVASSIGVNVFSGLFGLEDLTFWTNLLLGVAITTVVVDNFFDAIVMGGSAVAKMNEDKLPDSAKKLNAPKKEEMPLGIGTGSVTGTVVRGMNRLLSDNTERDCQCEAAAVFAAYSLGLPCFAFQPNALEGAALVLESMGENSNDNDEFNLQSTMDSLASDAGLLKVLIWLMAPVAMELSKYPQLMSSEPREARGFLQRLADKSKNAQLAQSALEGALPVDDEQTDVYLRWALAEADLLLRSNAKTVDALSEALAGGAATVGDCVAVLEEW
eukprot:CAMPEP_0201870028 /NCGR_PEP_ID=MMETSP0902-20130614/3304_1 /ASSEMBLY_ACC=CAM_ASM_000551 /TAXON_ID=420261 /ORGANISM="Thalassiosira antarctica, Strain CCMP982" /LENGTH=426 /DNA_ID=CAMNT_0048395599 /DNA_START=232 /DNA_END=1512 /DNA_ORIENTATION=-